MTLQKSRLPFRYPGTFTCTTMRKVIENVAFVKCNDHERRMIQQHLSHDDRTVKQWYLSAQTYQNAIEARRILDSVIYK